ncbi:MAG TPA: hypothetical protein VLY04_09580 [Bryobacteraceae bacterium]|nr:hypothetical protein [Bryobacteraceae bacterium]
MNSSEVRFPALAVKTMVCHTITYFFMGALAAHFLHYADMMAKPESGMRPMTSAWVMAGPLFQPLRGLVFATVFYPLRGCLFGRKYSWLILGWMLVGLGILSTFGPASGSIEGMVYTPTPVLLQLRGWLEVVPQALLFAALLAYWVEHPRKFLNWLLGTVFTVLMAMPVLGLLTHR